MGGLLAALDVLRVDLANLYIPGDREATTDAHRSDGRAAAPAGAVHRRARTDRA